MCAAHIVTLISLIYVSSFRSALIAGGGNYFMFGGEVKGSRVLGEYPKTFKPTDATNLGKCLAVMALSDHLMPLVNLLVLGDS